MSQVSDSVGRISLCRELVCRLYGNLGAGRALRTKERIVILASIGSVSPNLAPPAPAELVIAKLCAEPFAAFCARRSSGLGEDPSADLCKV
jgi:hypothetical protein